MTDQLPERFYGIPFKDDESPHWLGQFWSVRCSEDDIELLRADTVIPRSQAEAMVAAAVKQARYIAHIAWGWPESEASSMPVCEAISEITPADARAAFEQAVQEAVEEERERCAQVALRHFGYEPSEEEMHTVMDIAAAIRARREPSE